MCLLMSGVPSHESSFSLEATVICFALKTIEKKTLGHYWCEWSQAGRQAGMARFMCVSQVLIFRACHRSADIIGTCLTTAVFFPP